MRSSYLFSGGSIGKPFLYAMHYNHESITDSKIDLTQHNLVNYYIKEKGFVGFYLAETKQSSGDHTQPSLELIYKTEDNSLEPSDIKIPMSMVKNREAVQQALLEELFYQMLDEEDKGTLSFTFYEMNQYRLLLPPK